MSEPTFNDGTRWESGYYFACARLFVAACIAVSSFSTIGALTTEWDPYVPVEALPDWQKLILGVALTYVAVRSTGVTLRESNLLLNDHYTPYTAAQKKKRWENHRAG